MGVGIYGLSPAKESGLADRSPTRIEMSLRCCYPADAPNRLMEDDMQATKEALETADPGTVRKVAIAGLSALAYLFAGAAIYDRLLSYSPGSPCPTFLELSAAAGIIEPSGTLMTTMAVDQSGAYAAIAVFALIGIILIGSYAIVFFSKNEKAVERALDFQKMILGFGLGVGGTLFGVKS